MMTFQENSDKADFFPSYSGLEEQMIEQNELKKEMLIPPPEEMQPSYDDL